MKTKFIFLIFFASSLMIYSQEMKTPIDYVDPMIGTVDSRWMLYPGPSMPFGMVKLSPDNQEHKWKAGYDHRINNIAGFSHIHSWVMGGLLMMPATGKLQITPGTEKNPDLGYRSRIHHETEVARVGYYSVFLDDYKIKCELTATTRTGFQRYTFPASDSARILLDLLTPTEYNYEVDWAQVSKVNDHEIQGFSKQKTFDHFSSLNNEYTIYFVIQFSKPFQSFNGWTGYKKEKDFNQLIKSGGLQLNVNRISGRGDMGAFVTFKTENGEKILVKSGISLVSMEQARLNLERESGPFGWNFDAVVSHAQKTWNDLLGKIKVEGGSEKDKIKFYTNLYRSYSARTIWSDVNGKYADMCEQIVTAKDTASPVYGCDAFWNTFWNLNQLWELVTPDIANSWVESLLEIYDRGGWLPKGPTGIEYSSIMVASHEVALINSAYQKGIRNYDVNKAYEAIKQVQLNQGRAHPCGGLVGNRQLQVYMDKGYVPYGPGTSISYFGTDLEGPASNTLEYAFDDWNVAQMAKALGKEADYTYFIGRAHNYKNIFDKNVGYVRPRLTDGTWYTAKSAFGDQKRSDSWKGTGFIEGNAWQYTWFVPHDVNELVNMLGKEEFNTRLNKGFEMSARTNFNATGDLFADYPINHGNQPNMQAAYLFNYSGKPWLTQKWAREIMDHYYGSRPEDGWPGDEDQGQMGAWFVMSAMGLFEMDGGGSTKPIYEIGSPLFAKITIELDQKYYPGKSFVIEAKNVSVENRYIQKAYLNGKKLNKPWFFHNELVKGGKLELIMGSKPNKKWGSKPEAAPPSMSKPFE